MSPRAAWRLEAAGFAQVYHYVAGKSDWLATDLPSEGTAHLAGMLTCRGVATGRGAHDGGRGAVPAGGPGFGSALVLNQAGVVMGAVHRDSLVSAAGEAEVGTVMRYGVSMVRPVEDADRGAAGRLDAQVQGAGFALRAKDRNQRGPPSRRGSAGWCADPQTVTVRVAKFDLAPIWRLVCGTAELGHDGADVIHYQVDQGVWPGITQVLGEEQPRAATRDRHERGHAGLQAVLPFLRKTQTLTPGDRLGGVGGTEDRDDFPVHAGMVSQTRGLAGGGAARAPGCFLERGSS
jgi:hypothetical protein